MEETGEFAGQSSHINFEDLNLLEEIGRGAFGTVQRALLHGDIITAVKVIDIGNGVEEYQGEVRQLSKVKHENIIQLYGISKDRNKIYIIMEYADCGSLYDLLHPAREEDMIEYSLGHVVRWSLQCTRAVEYLHNLKPQSVVHRDLKPPNMLLTDLGTVVKICDFGTATAVKTEMTSNKGSAAWMAPEVFEGKRYSEKCDVYSFGIILWEMLSRKKPFDEIGAPAFRILWAVYNGTRPPPLQGIPDCLNNLMNNCWAKDAAKRPSFSELVKFFTVLDSFIEGADEPLFENYEPETYNAYDDPHVISIKATDTPVTPDYANMFPSSDHLFEHSSYRYPGPTEISPPYAQPQFKLPNPQSPNTYMSAISPSAMDYNRGEVEPVEVDPIDNVNWSVVPTNLMPVQPNPNIPHSAKLYNNYMEQLKKFIETQVRVDNLKVQKKNYESRIQEVNKTQQDSQKYLERFVKLANDKTELLTHYNMMKSFLEGEKRRMAMSNPRGPHNTP